ncbi:hypothetical protein TWF281_005019 [Arthrobotrys megalospora]
MAEDMMDVDTPELAASLETVLTFGTKASVTAVPYPKTVLERLVYSLEEGMDSKALDLLTHVSYAGISTPRKPQEKTKEIAIPPPEVLSIITTLSLHPTYTTRQIGLLETDVAIKASRYLRTITRLAGATNCQLQQAWQFKRSENSTTSKEEDVRTRRMRNRNVAKTGAVARKGRQAANNEIDITPFANLEIANEENVFKRCDDIWSLIGWALVCSCVYKKRWEVWRDFLELLIETLQNDFQERIDAAPDPKDMDIQGTLITAVGFLPDLAGGAGYKRIVRAIFANGSEKSRNEWTPVFPKETKKPPKKEYKKWKHTLDTNLYAAKRRGETEDALSMIRENAVKEFHKFRNNVNDTTEEYKDFRDQIATDRNFGDDESEEESGIRPAKKEDKSRLETNEEAVETWGGVQAIIIRLKLMALLTYAFAYDIPTLSCFYTEFTDNLRFLPIKQLTLFLSTSFYPCPDNPVFRGTILTTILQRSMVFQPPGGWNENTDDLNDDVLTTWYFPHYARGTDIEAQVRMGSVLESLARLWHVNVPGGKGIYWTEEMDEAVEKGIKVRREKATAAFKRKKVPTGADEELMKMLGVVEGRLRILMRAAKVKTLGRA